ncbi:hypothetical protein AcW1_003274 [Taiwanofungus camphoratus]|nr:hypothetical protein AcW1_003274 [Antrodia cinnamomea]
MVHYGHACMSQPSRLPVIYVFGKKEVDPADCVDKLLQSAKASASTKRTVFLRHDVVYAHIADSIVEKLQGALAHSAVVVYSPVPLISYPSDMQRDTTRPGESLDDAQSRTNSNENRASQSLAEDSIVLYIGGESLSLTNLLLTHASCEVHSYDPATRAARLESSRTNRLLMRRYAVVQKARDADVFGILVGTLGVASYLPLISHLRALISRAHKKSYTISVGKLNPAKLANFLEIECFVLVACPENSLIEAKEFLRPIITPYELEVALRAEQSWTGRYVLDFDKLLAEHRNRPEEENVKDLDQPEFSLVTGKYRHAKRYGDSAASAAVNGDESSSAAVVLRNQANTVALLSDSAAGQFLQTRTFRGLETRVGQDAPSMLEQGRSGIARGYQDDHRQQHDGNE